jgi:hypothetical protein
MGSRRAGRTGDRSDLLTDGTGDRSGDRATVRICFNGTLAKSRQKKKAGKLRSPGQLLEWFF